LGTNMMVRVNYLENLIVEKKKKDGVRKRGSSKKRGCF